MKLDRNFYSRDTITVAKELLGKVLVRVDGDKIYRGKIVETEAYLGLTDKASHAYGGKITNRTLNLYQEAGFSYVFLIYGMYDCFNVVTCSKKIPEAVLIRAIEPLSELDGISQNRYNMNYSELSAYKKKNISNGPGKLCKALKIDRNLNQKDLLEDEIYIEDGSDDIFSIVTDKRIGIDYSEEAKDFMYRFYIEGNKHVSKEK